MARGSHQIIALDLSGHDVFRAVLTDLNGEIGEEVSIPSPDVTGEDAERLVEDLLEWALQLTTAPVLGVGVAVPGIVDASGIVRRSVSLDWTDLDLGASLAARFGTPVSVANDANVAVLAEHSFGTGTGDMLLVKIDRGLGGGLLLDGRPVLGSRLTAGEIGRVHVRQGPSEAWVPLESIVTAPALRRRIERSVVGGDGADAALGSAGELLGAALSPLISTLDLTDVVLTGPHELVNEPLLDGVRRSVDERTGSDGAAKVIRTSQLGRDIMLRGAAALVLSQRLGIA